MDFTFNTAGLSIKFGGIFLVKSIDFLSVL